MHCVALVCCVFRVGRVNARHGCELGFGDAARMAIDDTEQRVDLTAVIHAAPAQQAPTRETLLENVTSDTSSSSLLSDEKPVIRQAADEVSSDIGYLKLSDQDVIQVIAEAPGSPSPLPDIQQQTAAQSPSREPEITPVDEDVIYIGIDFGTTHSGFAYAYGSSGRPRLQQQWPGEELPQAKTLSALLYATSTYLPVAWGAEARRQYAAMPYEEQAQHLYLESFKQLLSETEEQQLATCQLPDDWPHPPEAVIADFLSFLHMHMLRMLYSELGRRLVERCEMRYCVTVPTAWSETCREMLRRAVVLTGLVTEQEAAGGQQGGGRLSIVLEPAAAALVAFEQSQLAPSEGKRMLIVDAGGNTVNLTMHEVQPGGPVYRDYLLQGSQQLDLLFESWLLQRVDEPVFHSWAASCPGDYISFSAQWEVAKRSFEGTSEQGVTLLVVPTSLAQLGVVEGQAQDGSLALPDADMRALLDEVVGPIVQAIYDLVELAGSRPDHTLVVGGLGSQPYVRSRLQQMLAGELGQLLLPASGATAVLEGAVRYLQLHADVPAS